MDDRLEVRDESSGAEGCLQLYVNGARRAAALYREGRLELRWEVYGPQDWTEAKLLLEGLRHLEQRAEAWQPERGARPSTQADAPPKRAAARTVAATSPPAKRGALGARFRELIAAGELSDDEIFARVSAEFGLDESKRGYVRWYRKDLEKRARA